MNKKNKPHDLFFVERGAELFPQYAPALICVKSEFYWHIILSNRSEVSQGGGLSKQVYH